jgi:hypothetical protein
MAKKSLTAKNPFIVDRVLMVGALLTATAYIVRGTWAAMFLEAAAIVLGVIWSYRAVTTSPSREFRLAASLILILLASLLVFYLGSAQGLLHQVK